MSSLDTIAMLLVVIGAINWGLVGLLNLNIVESLLGMSLAKIVYDLVGVAGLFVLWGWFSKNK